MNLARAPLAADSSVDLRLRRWALAALLAVFGYESLYAALSILAQQPFGADFSCFWAGARAALHDPAQIYDFRHITELQGWPLGPTLRPYVYPPSALLIFAPFSALPLAAASAAWTALTAGLFLWAARRAGAPWWVALFPSLALVAVGGQITFAIGGLVLLGLALLRSRPLLAGVLLGMAATLKPQCLALLPLGLLAAGSWRTILSAGVTAVGVCALSALIWGVDLWAEWLSAVARFQRDVIPALPALSTAQIAIQAWLRVSGAPTIMGWLLAPVAVAMVGFTFRRSQDPLLRATAAFGGYLLIAPYAMHYEAALLMPGVAAMLARTADRFWPAGLVAAVALLGTLTGPLPVLAGLAPLLLAGLQRPRMASLTEFATSPTNGTERSASFLR